MQGFINGGMRKALMLLAGLMLAGTVSCGGGGGAIREVEGVGKGKNNPTVPTVTVVYNDGYDFTVQGRDMHSLEITFTSGLHEVFMLGKKGTCHSSSRDGIGELKVMSKSGDYWYFDGMGNPIPEDDRQASGLLSGTLGFVGRILRPTPRIQVSCSGGPYDKTSSSNGNAFGHAKRASGLGDVLVNISSNVTYTTVKVATSTDAVLTFDTPSSTTNGSYDTEDTVTVEAVCVTVTADGSKWYFDAAGNPLPTDSKWYQDLD
jgi:hypothetical protein